MTDLKTSRSFQQRFLDGFERSRIHEEVQRAKKSRWGALSKRYASMVLGASMAVTGIGVPMGIARSDAPRTGSTATTQSTGSSILNEFSKDLKLAHSIAQQVSGGVTSAVGIASSTLENPVARVAAEKAAEEASREAFFTKEIPFGPLIYQEAMLNDLSPTLVAAVVKTESRFVPTARSHRNAQGLMQLMPKTGRWMGANNLMNPVENVKAGAKYLRYLTDRFDGDQTKIIAAYNAGEGNVRKFGGVPPFRETQQYVARVLNSMHEFDDRVAGNMVEKIELVAMGR